MLLLSTMNWPNPRTSRMTQSKLIRTHRHTQRINSLRVTLNLIPLSFPQCCCLQEIQQDWFLHQSNPSERRGCGRHRFAEDPTRLPQPRGSHQAKRGGSRHRRRGHLAHAPRGAEAGTTRSLNMNTPFTIRQS